MNKNSYVEATLLTATHPHISKHTNLSSILISCVLIVCGIASVWVSLDMEEVSSTYSMLLLTLGAFCLLYAMFRLFWRSKEKVYTLTGSSIVEGSCYWDSSELQPIMKMLDHSEFKTNNNAAAKAGGNVRLDYLLSKDYKFAAVQLFQFVPYVYEPVTKVYYYTDETAANFAKYLIRNKL